VSIGGRRGRPPVAYRPSCFSHPTDEAGKYYLHFQMRAASSYCAGLRALSAVVGERTTAARKPSERIEACIDTPAISS
jgi:hypothetical protein